MIGKLLCFIGWHKWQPVEGAAVHVERASRWEMYEVTDGACERCAIETEIRREYFY